MTTANTRADDTLVQLANRLRIHNKWRRGDEDLPQADPTQLGLDIDAAVEAIDRVAAQAAEIADLRAKLAEAEGVVGRLPVTADGVPVVPGMRVWWLAKGGAADGEVIRMNVDELNDHDGLASLSHGWSYDINMRDHKVYSTESAARAAAEKGGGE